MLPRGVTPAEFSVLCSSLTALGIPEGSADGKVSQPPIAKRAVPVPKRGHLRVCAAQPHLGVTLLG